MRTWKGSSFIAPSITSPFTDNSAGTHHDNIDYVATEGIMVGYNATTFGVSDTLKRKNAAVVFARVRAKLLGETLPTTATGTYFLDVPANAAYAAEIEYAAQKGIFVGRANCN